MAKIKFGMMMTDARGKLGGQVFTKTRQGATVRTKVTPANRQSARQGDVRSSFAFISRAWSTDPAVDRDAWNAAVSRFQRTNVFGDKYLPSGKNLFMQLNQNLAVVNTAMETTPPLSSDAPSVQVFIDDIMVGAAGIELGFTLPDAVTADDIIVLEGTAPNNPGRFNFSGQFRLILQAPATTPPTASAITTAYLNKFGSYLAGQKLAFRAYIIKKTTGVASARSTAQAVVGA